MHVPVICVFLNKIYAVIHSFIHSFIQPSSNPSIHPSIHPASQPASQGFLAAQMVFLSASCEG
jgi:hypothetical protein